MFDRFLTLLLQTIIVIDILGAIAYFVLGGYKYRNRQLLWATSPPLTDDLAQPGVWSRSLFFSKLLPLAKPVLTPATDRDFDQLRRILSSFQQGLERSKD